jgi:hypothetical protein
MWGETSVRKEVRPWGGAATEGRPYMGSSVALIPPRGGHGGPPVHGFVGRVDSTEGRPRRAARTWVRRPR